MNQSKLIELFQSQFNTIPSRTVRSPGRVNIIGEHTDYNDGFVLPMALEHATWMAIKPREDSTVRAYSENFEEMCEFQCDHLEKSDESHWSEYIKAVAAQIKKTCKNLHGFDAVITSDIPIGAGLSSSASFELAVSIAFCSVNNLAWEPKQMAQLCQAAENQWVGVNCGIMDQLVCATGVKQHAVLLDCRSLEVKPVPLPKDVVTVIMDTDTRRGLVDSAYNERREQCESVARALSVKALRDITLDELSKNRDKVDPVAYQRAHHVVSENERVLHAVITMQDNDPVLLGELMKQSHYSLDTDFEVTNDALNVIVDCANQTDGCFGARMTGAGFGGCAIAIVHKDKAQYFEMKVAELYKKQTNLNAKIYVNRATDGCSIKSVEEKASVF